MSESAQPSSFAQTFAQEQIARVEALYAQLAVLEAKALDQSRTTIDESARLSRETLAYASNVTNEWRRASLEMLRCSARMFANPFFGG